MITNRKLPIWTAEYEGPIPVVATMISVKSQVKYSDPFY